MNENDNIDTGLKMPENSLDMPLKPLPAMGGTTELGEGVSPALAPVSVSLKMEENAGNTEEKPKEYLKKTKDIRQRLNISAKTWFDWKKAADFDVPLTAEGWEIERLRGYKALRASKDNRKKSIEQNLQKSRKLEIQIRLLNLEFSKKRGSLIEFSEHLAEMQSLLSIQTQALDFFLAEVSLQKNESLLKIAEKIRDETILKLKSKIESTNQKGKEIEKLEQVEKVEMEKENKQKEIENGTETRSKKVNGN